MAAAVPAATAAEERGTEEVQLGMPRLSAKDFRWFSETIYRLAGISLAPSKVAMVSARLAKRLRALHLGGFLEYREYLARQEQGSSEWVAFINALTTNKTAFFRENHHFDFLRDTVVPQAIAAARGGEREQTLSVWSAGCSTGEEPYTISMVLRDALRAIPSWRYRVLGSDIDTAVLEEAVRAFYPEDRLEGLADDIRRRHFVAEGRGARQVHPETRAPVTFRRVNLIEPHWPVQEQFDVVFCRNVIIYFDRETQRQLFERFAASIAPGGHLIVGHAESLFGITDRFERVRDTVYRLRPSSTRPNTRTPTPAPDWEEETLTNLPVLPPSAGRVAEAALQRPNPTASVAVDRAGWRRIIVGEIFASAAPARVSTLLGSCVSACLCDPERKVGGMNHFLLPSGHTQGEDTPARYGAYAMDRLVEQIVRLGGNRRRIVAKVFGATHAIGSAEVSRRNEEFVRHYLAREGIPLRGARLGGGRPMEVRFETDTGRAYVRYISEAPPGLEESEAEGLRRLDEEVRRAFESAAKMSRGEKR